MAHETPADSAGPSSPPPPLPEGWLAQWEGVSRRWYFVQRVTGKAQWEIPTEPAPLSPSTTPASIGSGPTWPPATGPQTSSTPQQHSTGDTLRGLLSSATEKAGLSNFQNFLSNPQRNPQLGGFTQMAAGMLNKLSNQFLHDKPSQHGSHGPPSNLPPVSTGLSSHFHSPPSQTPYGYGHPGQPGPYPVSGPQYRPQESAPFSPISPTSHYPGPAGYNQHPMSGPSGTPQPPWQQGPPPAVPPTTQPTSSYQAPVNTSTPVQQHYGQTFPPPPSYAPHGPYPPGNFPPPPPLPAPAQHMNSYGPGPGQPATQHPQQPSSQASQEQNISGPHPNAQPDQPSSFHSGSYHANQPYYPYTPGQPTPPAFPPGPPLSSAPQQPSHPPQTVHPTTSQTSQSSSHAFIAELPDTSVSPDKLSAQNSSANPAKDNVTAPPQAQTPGQQPQPPSFVSELPGNEPPRASQTDPQFVGGPFRASPDGRQEFTQSSSNQ